MTTPALVAEPTVQADDVSKWFGQKVAVSNLSCSFGPGIAGLLGPNGAGKTTLLRMMVGLLVPSQGSVTVLGREPRRHPVVYHDISLVPEDAPVYGFLTARQYVAYAARLAGVPEPHRRADGAIAEVQLEADADRALSGFSKGMRQRAKVAAALVSDPRVLVLDEPLNGTDPVQRARLIDLFRRLASQGKTVIVSSHVLAEVERMAERVIAIVDGRLAAAGNIGAIRRAMTDIPYRLRIDTDQPRPLAAAFIESGLAAATEVDEAGMHVETTDLRSLGASVATVARRLDATVTRFEPEDESLESVFRYLVRRRR